MESLPAELVVFILSKLDGKSLACASRVCKRWHAAVGILETGFNIWYKACVKEIGLDAMVASTGLVQLCTKPGRTAIESRKDKWKFWKRLYSNYQRSLGICCGREGKMKMQRKAEELWHGHSAKHGGGASARMRAKVTALEIVPSAEMCQGMMWEGCSKGLVTYYEKVDNTSSEDRFHLCKSFTHMDACTGLAAVSIGGCPGFATSLKEVETYVVSCGRDGHVYLTNQQGHVWNAAQWSYSQVHCVASLGPYFALGHVNSVTQGIVISKVVSLPRRPGSGSSLWRPKPAFDIVNIVKLKGTHVSRINSLDFSHDKLVAAGEDGHLYLWKFTSLSNFEGVMSSTKAKDGSSTSSSALLTVDTPAKVLNTERSVQQVLLLGNETLLLTHSYSGTGDDSAIVLVREDWETMLQITAKTLTKLSGPNGGVTCMGTSGPLLAVGCSYGDVLLFNLDKRNLWQRDLKSSFICHFDSSVGNLNTLKFFDSSLGKQLAVGGNFLCVFTWTWCDEEDSTGRKQEDGKMETTTKSGVTAVFHPQVGHLCWSSEFDEESFDWDE